MILLHSILPCNTVFWGYNIIVSLMHKCWLSHLSAPPCWTAKWVGSICSEINITKYGQSTPPSKNSHKKRALEVDPSSDTEELYLTLWSSFLVIQGTNKDIPLAKFNPFAIEKALKALAERQHQSGGSDMETSLLSYPRRVIQTVCCVPQCWQIVR